MMIRGERMRLAPIVRTKGEIIPIISMTTTIEIKEEEVEGKDLEEEVFMENVFTMEKKGIEHLNAPKDKEGLIEEMKTRLELCMSIKMSDHHILKMLKEEKS